LGREVVLIGWVVDPVSTIVGFVLFILGFSYQKGYLDGVIDALGDVLA
jgi:hypothetical protein